MLARIVQGQGPTYNELEAYMLQPWVQEEMKDYFAKPVEGQQIWHFQKPNVE